jgi:putrescine transport system ATP-binding protein
MSQVAPVTLRVADITKKFGAVTAVDAVTLDVRANEFLCLLGPSGCGKTTLLRMMAGLETPDSGSVFIGDDDVTAIPPHLRPVNMMFQSYALFPHMTVAGNVAFGLKQEGLQGAALAVRVKEALATVELEGLAERKPHQLSGGQRQRVALARCIAKRPRVLLLDEPLAALDKHLRERTQRELMALRHRLGISFVVVTHDQDEAMAMADRVAVMDRGVILQVAPPRVLYEQPASRAVAEFFGDVNIWEGEGIAGNAIRCPALQMTFPAAIPAGMRVSVAIRPEQIAISKLEGPLEGMIADVLYRGTVSTYFVRAGETVIRVTRQNAGDQFQRGDTVRLSWPETAPRVLSA